MLCRENHHSDSPTSRKRKLVCVYHCWAGNTTAILVCLKSRMMTRSVLSSVAIPPRMRLFPAMIVWVVIAASISPISCFPFSNTLDSDLDNLSLNRTRRQDCSKWYVLLVTSWTMCAHRMHYWTGDISGAFPTAADQACDGLVQDYNSLTQEVLSISVISGFQSVLIFVPCNVLNQMFYWCIKQDCASNCCNDASCDVWQWDDTNSICTGGVPTTWPCSGAGKV